jgi:arylsulfatase A-like enzyme
MKIAFIVLDAVRKDYLGPYGGDPDLTPTLNRLDDRGMTFTNCIAGAPWTPASHASMFTGRYPSDHNVRAEDLTFPDDGHYIPEELSNIGITTQGIGAEPWLSRRQGFDRGFDRFHDTGGHAWHHYLPLLPAGAGYAVDKMRCRFGTDDGSDRFDLHLFRQWANRSDSFTFFNISVAHAPYHPPAMFRQQFGIESSPDSSFLSEQPFQQVNANEHEPTETELTALRRRYAAGVAHADYLLGRAIDSLDDDTWIVVTADHGDLLGESGILGHQFSLRDELINVPLIIAHPSLEVKNVSGVVHHVDLAPTLYNILDNKGYDTGDVAEDLPGRSLVTRGGHDTDLTDDRIVFAEYGPPVVATNTLINNTTTADRSTIDSRLVGLQAAVSREFKYIRRTDGSQQLFRRDDESVDVSDDHPEIARRLAAAMDTELDSLPTVDPTEIDGYVDPDVEDQLKQLGYA